MVYVWSTKSKDTKIHTAANIEAEQTFCDSKIPENAEFSTEADPEREMCSKCLAQFE